MTYAIRPLDKAVDTGGFRCGQPQLDDYLRRYAAQDQRRLLTLCGIDPAVFDGHIDPAAFITLAIQEGVRNRVHANGTVNLAPVSYTHLTLPTNREV